MYKRQAYACNDRILAVGGQDGRIFLLDIDPDSDSFNRFIGETAALAGPILDLATAPDGLSVFAVCELDQDLYRFNVNPGSASFGGQLGFQALGALEPQFLAVSPEGGRVLVGDPLDDMVHLVDWEAGASTPVPVTGSPARAAYHPEGRLAFVVTPGLVIVLDADPASSNYGTPLESLAVPDFPNDLAFSPDGNLCYVLTGPPGGVADRTLVTLDCSNPLALMEIGALALPATGEAMQENLALSPAGDRALLNLRSDGLVLVDLSDGGLTVQGDLVPDDDPLGFAFSTDGARCLLYTSDAADDLQPV